MAWELQSILWKFLPATGAVSMTLRVFGLLLLLSLVILTIGLFLKKSWLKRGSLILAALTLSAWGLLHVTRPVWLRIALQTEVPVPTFYPGKLEWKTRIPGLETAELELRVNDSVVDHMALVRLDPHRFRFSVHWDKSATRTAETWQKELGAAVVVNGSYFGFDKNPLTPLRLAGKPAGPADYQSSHGVFVADADGADILDLRNQDVFATIGKFPEAMVSYPLLLDAHGEIRLTDSKHWLASRNFVALDQKGRVVIGTTQTGFFTLYRLAEFLKTSPLDLRMALNFDGGPLVSQVVKAGDFSRNFHGTAEISDGSDVLRAFWHARSVVNWPLPIVLAAIPKP